MKITKSTIQQIIKEEVEAELHELHKQQLIHEGILRTFFNALKGIPGGMLQNIKEWMASKVLDWIGVDKGTPFHKIAVNFFGNLEMDDLAAIMSGDQKCITLTSELAGGFTEYLAEKVPNMLGIKSDGWFAGAYRESLGEEFLSDLNQNIGAAICELNFSRLFGGGDDDKENINEIRKMLQEESNKYIQLREEKEEKEEREKDDKWIQGAEKDIEERGTEGVCTGDKFGSASCPEGSKRYNLAKTFREMAKDRKKKE